jgi:hypothetical protein
MNIPLDGTIECVDGTGGSAAALVFDPATRRASHLVVRVRGQGHDPYLLPLDRIDQTNPQTILVLAACDELAELEPLDREGALPASALVLQHDAAVHASNGFFGKTVGFWVNKSSGEVEHLVLSEGRWRGKKHYAVALDEIDHFDEDAIHLKLSSDAVKSLPRV